MNLKLNSWNATNFFRDLTARNKFATAQGFAVAEGTPTWFLFAQVTDVGSGGLANTVAGVPEGKTGIKLGLAAIGTVGNEASTADMRLVGGNIVNGVPYKFMDVDFTINSPV